MKKARSRRVSRPSCSARFSADTKHIPICWSTPRRLHRNGYLTWIRYVSLLEMPILRVVTEITSISLVKRYHATEKLQETFYNPCAHQNPITCSSVTVMSWQDFTSVYVCFGVET